MKVLTRILLTVGVTGLLYLPVWGGWKYIVGFIAGFIVANVIFYSNNPLIVQGLKIITGNRQSMIKNMMQEEIEYEKSTKVRYKK